jgi:hypothetical protein
MVHLGQLIQQDETQDMLWSGAGSQTAALAFGGYNSNFT